MILHFLLIVFYAQQFVHGVELPSFTEFSLYSENTRGPESLAFKGVHLYTGVQDGRILKYNTILNDGFKEFATTSPLRTNKLCNGASGTFGSTCGRPLGLGWNYLCNELYIADGDYGLLVVSGKGGLATQLKTGYNGTRFALPEGLDIDQKNQIVYFTDSGSITRTGNVSQIVQSEDSSGKLYKYDIKTKQTSLLLDGLFGPTGVAVSKDSSFVVIPEYIRKRIRRFWLTGPKANSSEVLVRLPGHPDNVKTTPDGNFFAAVTILRPLPAAIGMKFDTFGKITKQLDFTNYYDGNYLSEVQEVLPGLYYTGSFTEPFVGKYY